MFVKTNQKIKIQSRTGLMNESKCSERQIRRSTLNLGQGKRMQLSVSRDEGEDQNSIWDTVNE